MVGSAAVRDFRARKQSPIYSEVFRIVICPSSSSNIILHRQRSDIAWSQPLRKLFVLHAVCCTQSSESTRAIDHKQLDRVDRWNKYPTTKVQYR